MIGTLVPDSSKQPQKYNKKVESIAATECANCGTTTTPLWRRGPNGETICNACGLYLKARNTLRPVTLKRTTHKKPSSSSSTTPPTQDKNDCGGGGTCPGGGQCNGTGGSSSCAGCPAFNQHQVNRQALICANCRTTTTPLWRRDDQGNTICNACGLYYKLHNVHRPVSMKRSVIKRRKRIIVTQGSDDEEVMEDAEEEEVQPSDTVSKHVVGVPEIEENVVILKKKTSDALPPPPPRQLLPPISSERQYTMFHHDASTLPSLSLPPLTPPSSQPIPTHHTPMHIQQYELADFDHALDRLEHLRRQVRPEQAYALSQLTQSLSDLTSKAEAILSLDSLAYGR